MRFNPEFEFQLTDLNRNVVDANIHRWICLDLKLQDKSFIRIQFTHLNCLNSTISSCRFIDCHLDHTVLNHTLFKSCLFSNVTFSNSIFRNSLFINCTFLNCLFTPLSETQESILNFIFDQCYFADCSLNDLYLFLKQTYLSTQALLFKYCLFKKTPYLDDLCTEPLQLSIASPNTSPPSMSAEGDQPRTTPKGVEKKPATSQFTPASESPELNNPGRFNQIEF